MKYRSTRDASSNFRPQFMDILLGGLAPDGGLYLPEYYPQVGMAELANWRSLSYADLAFAIMSKFVDDIPANELQLLLQRTYTSEVFSNVRDKECASDIVPLNLLGEEQNTSLHLLALSNGPTLAFKDIAMQFLGHVFEYALKKNNQILNILGATSGDTGSAAEYAMRGKQGVKVFMLSPRGKMSAFQTAQMYSLMDDNIINIAIDGVFDNAQDIVKAVSNDAEFKAKYHIGTVNSINWARVLAQVVYYFKGYFAATSNNQQMVSFAVPSGNFGNVCAGHIAKQMGLPIKKLVVATNENDVLDEFFKTGRYRVRNAAQTYHTSSPSMDISKASNFERFVFDLLGGDALRVAQLFQQVETTGGFDLSVTGGSGEWSRIADFGFVSGRSTHGDRLHTIRDIYAQYKRIVDTHTADGIKVAREYLEPDVPMIVLETAQPIKFEAVIQEALGFSPPVPPAFQSLLELPQRVTNLPAQVESIKQCIVLNA